MHSNVETVGVSPKLIGAVILAVISYILTQEVIELAGWVEVAINAIAVAIGAFFPGPGTVTTKRVQNNVTP